MSFGQVEFAKLHTLSTHKDISTKGFGGILKLLQLKDIMVTSDLVTDTSWHPSMRLLVAEGRSRTLGVKNL